ncbi:MAG: hypothetical protein DRP42_01740 [Tenericutes bacterium]|nr:MAG: hypothetical protein DRP42_01740 [Mycoplasmatota bacterium]
MNIMKSGEEAVVSNIPVKAYTISAAVPGTFAFVFKTKDGNIVYATDYISDETPQLETDHNLFLDDMSKEKNLVFMSDSFNSKLDGFVSPKHSIKDYIINQLDSDARVVASIYEDELVNVYELIQLSAEYNKKIYIFDKKIFEMLNFIMDKGYFAKLPLELYKPGIEKKNSIVVITGTRTDLYQTLKRIIQEDDIDTFNITKEDTIFLASPPQPGNEHIYAGIGNDLSVFNPDVISVHIKDKNTFHPAKGDLDRFIKKINPKHFMPIKG